MIKRIVNISKASFISLKSKQLVVKQEGDCVSQIIIEDLGVLILENNQTTITQGAIIACQKNNVAIILCDERHLPYSLIQPLTEANNLHSKTLKIQMSASNSTKNRIWKSIVRQKIIEQNTTLNIFGSHSNHLQRLASEVKSGDNENKEAQAAKLYWKILMGDDFRRDFNLNGVNSILNYGYAVIRAVLARAIVGTGLHSAIGVHHSNQYNGFCLADDIMEPFRPWVDAVVYELVNINGHKEINIDVKRSLLNLIHQKVEYRGKVMPFLISTHRLAACLKANLAREEKVFEYPKRLIE